MASTSSSTTSCRRRISSSVRYSFQRPTVFEPGNYADGVFGGPYQGGFVGTGVNKTQSVAGNWTRTLTNTFVMDARFGVSTYHNTAVSAGSGLNTATEVGIPGANLDELHERDDRDQPAGLLEPDRRLRQLAAVEPRRDDLHGGRD